MLDALLDALTLHGSMSFFADDMKHTAGPGFSKVEWWNYDRVNRNGPWVWRVRWRPDKTHKSYPSDLVRVAFGIAENPEAARRAGRWAATKNAKAMRNSS